MKLTEINKLIDTFKTIRCEELTYRLSYLKRKNIDFDVYLPTIGMNLQRELVWTLDQKRELIYSVLIGRNIPHFSFVNIIVNDDNLEDAFQVIDGKQRLTTLLSFYDNEFTIKIDDEELYLNQLPESYQETFNKFYIRAKTINEPYNKRVSDEQKINWFKLINFAGTPQDFEHIKKLTNENK